MKSKQKLVLDKYLKNKFWITVEQCVTKTIGDVWSYDFEVLCSHTKVFNKLKKVEKKEGYISITSVTQETDEHVQDDYWKYKIQGSINGGSPFEHGEMVKDLERIVQ